MKTKLLNIGQLAAELGVPRGFVTAMKACGFRMPGGRSTVEWALQWLRDNPAFDQGAGRRKAAKAADMSAG